MIRRISVAVAIAAVALAQDSSQSAALGHWSLAATRPGVVEPQAGHLHIQPGDETPLAAVLSIPGREIAFTGEYDAAAGTLALHAQIGDQSATLHFTLEGDRLHGQADLPGQTLPLEGVRAAGPPPAPVEVDFSIERPFRAAKGNSKLDVAALRDAIGAVVEDNGVVGLSAAFVVDREIVEVISIGWEDFAARTPASEKTLYRWASVAKPLTAIAALQLVDAGKLDLDADIRKLVPEYDRGVAMTMRQLLAHRAGVPHYAQLKVRTMKEYDRPHPWTDRITALDMFSESDLVHPPGTGYHYSTPGYALAGAVIQRAGDGTYAEQVRRRICAPLGMTTMRPDYIWENVLSHAAAYQHEGRRAFATELDDISWKLPAGGWISTVEDMARFGIGVIGTDLLQPETHDLLCGRGGDKQEKRHALGIGVGRLEEHAMLSHSGGQVGASTYLLCSPETGHVVALAANTEGVGLAKLARELMSMMMNKS